MNDLKEYINDGYIHGSPDGRRVINTARTGDEINKAAEAGFWPVVKPVIPNPSIHDMLAVFQDEASGRIDISIDGRLPGQGKMVVDYMTYYPYRFPSPFAAYLVPSDLKEGEEVWLDDVIEDIVGAFGNQNHHPRLASCPAIWNGRDFDILFDTEDDIEIWVG